MNKVPRLRAIREGSVRSRVIETIRDAIFSGKFKPGDNLVELYLSRDLGVSQSTVREALLHLENRGLVVRTPNKSATVTKLTSEEVRERISLRVLLETVAAIDASQKLSRQDFAELDRRLKAVLRATSRNDYFGSAVADLDFHRYIWECSGNKTLFQTLDHLVSPLFAFVSLLRSGGLQNLEETVLSHQPIIAALESKDPQEIMTAISSHVSSSYGQFLASGIPDLQMLALANRNN